MSIPPRGDLPIEWRTETGEYVAAAGTTATAGRQPAGRPPEISDEDAVELHPQVAPEERRAARRIQAALALLALVGLGIAWALGGLDAAPTGDGIRSAAVGDTVDTGPYRLSVDAAAVLPELNYFMPSEEGGRLLALAVTAEVTADRTRAIDDAVSLVGVAGLVDRQPRQVLHMRDLTTAFFLQPALPERVVYVWDLEAGAATPTQVEVLLNGATYRKSNFDFINEWDWRDPGPRARVVVPVEDRTGQPS